MRAGSRLKGVGFDLWETLITDTPEAALAQEALRIDRLQLVLLREGLPHSKDVVQKACKALWHICLDRYWSADVDIPARRQIAHFLEALGLEPEAVSDQVLADLEQAYVSPAGEIPPQLLTGVADTLEQLRAEGYVIGLVSNTGRTPGVILRAVLQGYGLSDFFKTMVFSNEHGECKPRPSIFARLARELGLDPGTVAFVGDNLYCDVFGAQRQGMRGILFNPPTRGLAVASAVDHGHTIVPDATITTLAELPAVLERWGS